MLNQIKNLSPENQKILALCSLASAAAASLLTSSILLLTRGGGKGTASPASPAAAPVVTSSNTNKTVKTVSDAVYLSEDAARQYMEFHYTPTRESYSMKVRTISEAYDFPTRIAAKFKIYLSSTPGSSKRGLDIGCATGASVLEMSKYFEEVIGIDYSEIFVYLADQVVKSDVASYKNKNEAVAYEAPVQGTLTEPRQTYCPKNTFPDRCQFYVGDATDLTTEKKQEVLTPVKTKDEKFKSLQRFKVLVGAEEANLFDGVLCVNLIDRIADPKTFLENIHKVIKKRGVLVLADPYSWSEASTPVSKWLGAVPCGEEGTPALNPYAGMRSEEVVRQLLAPHFDLRAESEEPFLIRDHIRHYQLGFSHCTVWVKK